MGQARVDGGNLDLNRLLQSLKGLMNKSSEGSTQAVGQQSAEEIRSMLARLGMGEEAAKIKGPISLKQFVQIVEEKAVKLMPHSLSRTEVESCVKGLLENVVVASEKQEEKSVSTRRNSYRLRGLSKSALMYDAARNNGKGIKHAVAYAKNSANDMVGGQEGQSLEDEFLSEIGKVGEKIKKGHLENGKMAEMIKNVPSGDGFERKDSAAVPLEKEVVAIRDSASGGAPRQSAKTIPLHVLNQVGRQIGLSLRRGENQFKLQLKPPHLGSVQLEMVMKDNILKVAIVAEHQSVKDLLLSHVHELREALVEQGVELHKVDVEINQNFSQSLNNSEKGFNQRQAWGRSLASATGTEDGELVNPGAIERQVRSDTLLDMFA